LAKACLPGVNVVEAFGDGSSLIDVWDGAEHVILIDAACSGATPGTLHRIEAHDSPMPKQFSRHSTHSLNIADTIELARLLNRLPPRVTVFAVEGEKFTPGVQISARACSGIEKVVRIIVEELTCAKITPPAVQRCALQIVLEASGRLRPRLQ
jgi:hydrogenase maturation protease